MTGIQIRLDDREVTVALRALKAAGGNMREAFQSIGSILLRNLDNRFLAQMDPDGHAWVPLSPGAVLAKAQKRLRPEILRATGQLRQSFTASATKKGLVIGTVKEYAAIHQFGGKTKAHRIVAKSKKALAWPGGAHPVKGVNHPGSKIPARPMLGLSAKDRTDILDQLGQYFREALDRRKG